MTYLGDWQRGMEFPIVCQATDGVSPAWPDRAPQLALFSDDDLIRRIDMPADAQAQIPGLFRYPLFLDGTFPSSGPIHGFVQWVSGGDAFSVPLFFRILPGGDPIGTIISMTYVRRPSMGYVVYQVDSECILRAKNPRVQR